MTMTLGIFNNHFMLYDAAHVPGTTKVRGFSKSNQGYYLDS